MGRILILVSLLLFPTLSWSAPAVTGQSGTLTTGQSITISGSDFGSHTLQTESLQANIESGTVGNTPSKTNWTFTDWASFGEVPKYANDSVFSGTKSIKCQLFSNSPGGNCAFAFNNPAINPGEKYYATWWIKYTGDTVGQWKMHRISGEKTIVDTAPTVAMFNWLSSSSQLAIIGQTYEWPASSTYPGGDNKWYRVEAQYTAGSAGSSNGTLTVNRYTDTGTITGETFTGIRTHSSGQAWNWTIFQNYLGNDSLVGTFWTDDPYIQKGTFARVELCTGSAWNTRGKCMVQVPTTWSATSITATANTGNLAGSSTAYLYVVNDSGTQNTSGFEVTVGGEGGGGEPPPSETVSLGAIPLGR